MLCNDELNDEFNEMYGKETESENKIAKAIKLTDNISSIGIKKAILKDENASLQSVIESMQISHSSCILIINNNKITGIFTERDVITKIVGKNVNYFSMFLTALKLILKTIWLNVKLKSIADGRSGAG